ncbi:MAG: heavy metal translocating P-type ATPase [Acidobacteriaceae bacterium]
MTLKAVAANWFNAASAHRPVAILATATLVSALVLRFLGVAYWSDLLLGGIVVCGLPLFYGLVREVVRGNFSVDLLALLSVATSLVMHQYWVAIIVILMLSGGKTLEDYATGKASSVLSALAKRMPQTAHVIDGASVSRDIPVESVAINDQVVIYPHEICPVDGVVLSGSGSMDESYLTGEPFEIAKAPGSTVLSGAINGSTLVTIRAASLASNSRYAQIVGVLHESERSHPRMRRLGDRLGGWYTPIAVAAALLSWGISGHAERFLAVLVIATPCPLLIGIPVAIISAISVAARRGIVIKDAAVLENISTCRSLIVDKTGTLTYGKPLLTEVLADDPADRNLLLQLAASVEMYSKHPLASAILDAATRESVPLVEATEISEAQGSGLRGQVGDHSIWVTGRKKIPESLSAKLPPTAAGLECVAVIDDRTVGLFRFEDQPRHDTKPFLDHLKPQHQIDQVTLLSGDRMAEVALFASRMHIEHVYGGMSPEQKVAVVRDLTKQARTIYVGDGINDAPAMLNATVGIALGVNSEITSEAAGAVVLESSLRSVDELMHIGARMRRIALQSAVGGMSLSLAGMLAASLGMLSPIHGALLQEAIDLLAVLNSLRMILPSDSLSDYTVPAAAPDGAVMIPSKASL